jgi:hypothetical protein
MASFCSDSVVSIPPSSKAQCAYDEWMSIAATCIEHGRTDAAKIAEYFAAVALGKPHPSQYAPDFMQDGLRHLDDDTSNFVGVPPWL